MDNGEKMAAVNSLRLFNVNTVKIANSTNQNTQSKLESAELGDVNAQLEVGLIYLNGDGINQNHKEALKWFRRAAKQGSIEAQFNIGLMYGSGIGISKNNINANAYYLKAAENGHGMAQFILGNAYLKGWNGVKKNKMLGVEWLKKSAENGNLKAKSALANITTT